MRALVVDDSRAIRMILARSLKALGFEILEAGNGREALDRLQDIDRVDLLLVDWNMPEMNGYELVQAVRSEPSYSDLYVVMVTTEAETSQVIKALEAGANEYIIKPFTKETIHEKLQILGLVGP